MLEWWLSGCIHLLSWNINTIFNVVDATFYCFYANHVFTFTSFTRFNLRIEQQIVLLILSVTAVPYYCCQLFNLHRPNSHVCSDWSTVAASWPSLLRSWLQRQWHLRWVRNEHITFPQIPQRQITLMPIKGAIWAHFDKHLLQVQELSVSVLVDRVRTLFTAQAPSLGKDFAKWFPATAARQ